MPDALPKSSLRAALVLVSLGGGLAACTTTADAPAPAPAATPVATNYVTPSTFRLPEGAGCSGELQRFRAVMDNDLATGHVAREVYGRVIADLAGPEGACAAGRDGEARAGLRAVKTRYGYP